MAQFYRQLFGWRLERASGMHYWRIATGAVPDGGLVGGQRYRPIASTRSWVHCVHLELLNATVAGAEQPGAIVLRPTTAVPKTAWYAVLADPEGNIFAIYSKILRLSQHHNRIEAVMTNSYTRRTATALLGAASLLFLRGGSAAGQVSEMPPKPRSEAEQIALDAYIYGYSLITTEITRVQMSNVDKIEGMHAPSGQFANIKRYPPADFRGVSAPNADTLYSVAWLDLAEPQVFSHPDMGKRFYLFEMSDLWMTDFNSPGTRTAGSGAANYLITGPGWAGAVPAGMKQIKCATRYMVILGRTYADGTDQDYAAVNALQAQYKIVPLSAYGKSYTYQTPPVDSKPGFSMTDAPQAVILDMDTSTYFNMMARLMGGAAPPVAEDAPMLTRMAKIGLVPGQKFDMTKLDPAMQTALKDLGKAALQRIEANKDSLGAMVNGWVVTKGLGVYGTDYMKRAVVAAFGWPANLPQDAVYPYTEFDGGGRKLSGANSTR